MKKLTKQLAIVIIAALLLAGVAGSEAVAAKKAKISNSKLALKVGQTKKISVKNLTKKQQKKVKWSSRNKKVASVNKSGKVTAKKKGTAKITAKVGKKKYTCKVTVNKRWILDAGGIHSFRVAANAISIPPGEYGRKVETQRN